MDRRQTVAIIGAAGKVGRALAVGLANAADSLLLFDHDAALVDELVTAVLEKQPYAKVEAMECPVNASWEADVIFLATQDDDAIAPKISDVANLKTVIRMVAVEHVNVLPARQLQQTEEVARQLRNSRLVTVYFTLCPLISENADIKIATSHEAAGQQALQFIRHARLKQHLMALA